MQPVKEISKAKMQRMLWMLGIFKIPLLAFCRPKLVSISEKEVTIGIHLRRRTRNHLGSMYFGALSVGADVSGGILAFYFAERYGLKISFAFKSFEAQFHKRAETDVTFHCTEGDKIKDLVMKAKDLGERQNEKVEIFAKDKSGTIVASFLLELSVKVK
ncbi:protein of unknown function [Lishizhenia tianjinensis]|uniref:Acyl-coenzyme A thioesterase PaaI, contains HGG motif n=1 Tax=Lishizhenia tianjinensis TaxID=477690 RepID=A0A1I6YQP1_9FLAO|nr:DUF4442 domain-containing protein [Lishizhenia tianjinensis]SFT52806.1 protein of unknown function [Lishizhenia tianjinensis]